MNDYPQLVTATPRFWGTCIIRNFRHGLCHTRTVIIPFKFRRLNERKECYAFRGRPGSEVCIRPFHRPYRCVAPSHISHLAAFGGFIRRWIRLRCLKPAWLGGHQRIGHVIDPRSFAILGRSIYRRNDAMLDRKRHGADHEGRVSA